MAHTFTVTTSLLLSDPSPSDRSSNATAQSLLDLLATAPSSKENTTLTRILSTAINVVTFGLRPQFINIIVKPPTNRL
ncbi:hypothetical protein MMC31_000879 [Peltigera leucophlebia]|nr:hypothetical protein [Peltigera leucophlebia]